jgi:sec-independent protein translocase protein TatA
MVVVFDAMELTPYMAIGMPGGPEWMFIIFVVLLLFGAKKLPELARGLGKSIGEFKKAREEFEGEIHRAADEEEKRKISAPEKEKQKTA